MKRLLFVMVALLMTTMTWAQGVKPLPSLHVDGRWLVDAHGNHVVLHGVMDTPSMWFNGHVENGVHYSYWTGGYNSEGAKNCLAYFEKILAALEVAKCNVFRLHLEPAWTNDPTQGYVYEGSVDQPAGTGGEADISHFNPTRLKTYLNSVYFPIIKRAMLHGQYVVIRPPGVCPGDIKVGDYYNQYLMTVWDIVTKNDSIKKYAGQISIELANEPVALRNANNQDDPRALHDFFQPIVDKIRANGFTGIIWAPGTGWQANYTSYASYPIEGYNIGYAVHDYTGWYGCSDQSVDNDHNIEVSKQKKINQFHNQVPVVDTNPIIITEVDWSPPKPGTGHYNEHGDWVESNYGTWSTGSTSKWGVCYKAMLDYYGNISMTLSGTACLIDIPQLLRDGSVVPAFGGIEEACGKACMDWYADYYNVDWPHPDFANISLSDQGTGKYKNPVVYADFPDPDVICVNNTYYMVSTTMHHFPGATILKSTDLVNWEYCAQPLTQLSENDRYSLLNNQNAYAAGMWACSMKYHNGKFYLLINGNDTGGWLLTATDPEGRWEKKQLSRIYYDPGMLFDNGKVYVACGIENIQMCELDEDFNFIQEKRVISDKPQLEGCHLYKVGDYYYIYATYGGWPSGQAVFRSKNIFGPYEEKMLLERYINNKPNTIHQGALIETPEGEWWTILQEDLGAFGRMPNLQPVKWVSDWPIIGNNGKPVAASGTTAVYKKPLTSHAMQRVPLPTNDNFRSFPLGQQWQWNHNPDDGAWSLFERQGWLRMRTSGTAESLPQARNMLTQRIFAIHGKESKASTGTIRLDVSHLEEGDRAGICILQDPYAMLAVEKKADGGYQLVWKQDKVRDAGESFVPAEQKKAIAIDSIIYLRASITKNTDKTQFYYSLDNKTYTKIGSETKMSFNLTVFVGARFGIFCYASTKPGNGYADFDWFSTETDYDETMFYPANFEGYNKNMLTVQELKLKNTDLEVMVGNTTMLELTATYLDGHSANVAPQANYTMNKEGIIKISGGRIQGIKEGNVKVHIIYTDPLGNEQELDMNVRSTFFPFGKDYINTSIYSNGNYNEKTHTFRPGQWGQMGWVYPNGADMSEYKYLVVNLKSFSSGSHLNIFPSTNIWGACHSTPDFGSKKQIVVDLQNAKYTNDGAEKGQPLDTKNIRIVSFWGNGNQNIVVSDIYLTNNEDYSPSSIEDANCETTDSSRYYDLQGRQLSTPAKKGIYIRNGRKIVVR